VSKRGSMLAVVSLIFALAGVGVGVFSFMSLNNYINETNAYVLPKARVYYDGPTYTITSGGGLTIFNYNQKSYDSHGAFDLLLDYYRVPETGYYQIIAQYSIYADDGDFFQIQLYSNNILVSFRAWSSSVTTNIFGVALTDIVNFNQGDTLSIKLYQYNSGSLPRDIFVGDVYTFFAIAKIA